MIDEMIDYQNSKAWPFVEAKKIVEQMAGHTPSKGHVLFETGYSPSGLPHIGTFGEVLRTSMVRHAFSKISDIPSRLFAFSDDMDGFRKVPDNLPNQDMLHKHMNLPLTKVPDPFGEYESLGHHNNAMLRRFLDSFGFEYEFQSATDWYTSGRFDEVLMLVLTHYDAIMDVMLPSLRAERQATYSPFLPLCPRTGAVLQVPIIHRDAKAGTVTYPDPDSGKYVEVPVTGGHCKLQWKVDFAARWRAFDVDYEMSGKDHIDTVKLSSQICRILGGKPASNLIYELFLDEQGQKISKSKGNGLTIDEWLAYAPEESLAYYMFQSPHKAKRLYFDVIPKNVDEYLTQFTKYGEQDAQIQLDNPIYHIHQGHLPDIHVPLSFNILLNLASVVNCEDPSILWGFVSKHVKGVSKESHPYLDKLIQYAVKYYHDFIAPHKHYRAPTDMERSALNDLCAELQKADKDADESALQAIVFEVGKRHAFAELRAWFGTLYEVLLGQKEGPRFGSFIAVYGVEETVTLIQSKV
ncbi:MAG: lysine--tRNA ligase [Alphaproteobacteria bacterium]|nr:lysine--tRNA ligase [Alphaproteobacteria bacterium]